MNHAGHFFNNQINTSHIQRKQVKDFSKLCQEGKAVFDLNGGSPEPVLQELENDKLNYSNDMVIDMIIKFVLNNTSDGKLIDILKNIRIAHVDNGGEADASAYPRFEDGSYYIEMEYSIERKIRFAGDLLAVLFMFNEQLNGDEPLVLKQMLSAMKERFIYNTEFTEESNSAEINMLLCDKLYGDSFTDKYILYAGEIHEMAMAFLIGHEIGHHYYGDTENLLKSGTERKMAELNADSFALDFAFDYLKVAYHDDNGIYGIHFFTAVYLPLTAYMDIADDIYEDGENYPSIIKRMLGVQRGLSKMLAPDAWEMADHYRNLLINILSNPIE